MNCRHAPSVWPLILLLSLMFAITSCDVNSSSSESEKPTVEVSLKPANSGVIKRSGNRLYASAGRGYYFQYWKLTNRNGTVDINTQDSIFAATDSVKQAKAVFNHTKIFPVDIKSTSSGHYAYFVFQMYVPIDTTGRQKFGVCFCAG